VELVFFTDLHRQVQDLQSQLSDAKRTINHLQNLVHTTPTSATGSPSNASLRLPELSHSSQKGRAIAPLPAFDHVRWLIQTHSRGVFKLPPMYRPFTPSPVLSTPEVSLPPRKITDTLLSQFYAYYNTHMPFIERHAFTAQVDKCYSLGTLQGVSQVWVSNFFAALACGSLQTVNRDEPGLNPDKDGIQYMVIASRLLNTWTDNLLLDHARTSIMISMFLNEQNIRSAGWIWLGSGVRIIQDIGLHLESGPWSSQERDARRLVYWTIFSYDR
jgi:Fungal specific transcription factor domain